MIRVHLTNATHCTVHYRPSWFGRLFGREERDFEAWRCTELGGRYAWVEDQNREVSGTAARAIDSEITKRAAAERIVRGMRGGR